MEFVRKITPAVYKGQGLRRMRIQITFTDDGVLMLSGGGPRSQGQCLLDLVADDVIPTPGFNHLMLNTLYHFWKHWHLNNMKAGDPVQEREVWRWRYQGNQYSYEAACKHLEKKGLLVHDGYRYGSAWKKEEVPDRILKWLFTLPGVGNTYDDIVFGQLIIDDKDINEILFNK